MPRNRDKYRKESLARVRVNGQDIHISPYLAQYTADGRGEADHVRQMTRLVAETRLEYEIADEFIALNQGKRSPLAAAIRAKKPSTNSPDPSLSTNASQRNTMGDLASDGETPGNPSQHSSQAQT